CPLDGVWSEWTAIGPCPSTCGACGVARRKRRCTSLCGDCPCTGPSDDVGTCGLALCPWPAPETGTCCKPYKKSLDYTTGEFFCGSNNLEDLVCI
ncbi:hypothetical protein PENTCL1PPCAC_1555, partial [Pristionchus entomophagus]